MPILWVWPLPLLNTVKKRLVERDIIDMMLLRVTLVLMMVLLCSKPEHELPHQPQFLPSPRNLSITGLLRWALFYFAAPYCPTSMARCLIFFLVLNGGGAIKNTSYLYVIAEGEEASLPCRVKNLFQHYTVREVYALGSPGFTVWTSNDNTESPKMQLPTLEMKFWTSFENIRRCPG